MAVRQTQRLERIRGFARLRDGDGRHARLIEQRAVAELRGIFDLDRDTGQRLEHVAPDERCMP